MSLRAAWYSKTGSKATEKPFLEKHTKKSVVRFYMTGPVIIGLAQLTNSSDSSIFEGCLVKSVHSLLCETWPLDALMCSVYFAIV